MMKTRMGSGSMILPPMILPIPRPFRSRTPVVASPLRIRHSSFVIGQPLRACMAVRDGYAKIEDILPATPVIGSSRR